MRKRQADQRVALAREQAARAAAEEAVRRSAFLAEGGRLLASSLDAEALARDFTHFAVPFLGSLAHDRARRRAGARHAHRDRVERRRQATSGRKARSVRRVLEPAIDGRDHPRAGQRAGATSSTAPWASAAALRVERLDDGREERVAIAFHPQSHRRAPAASRAAARSARSPSRWRRRASASRPPSWRWARSSPGASASRSTTRCSTCRCATTTAARTSSWRCSRTSCAARWRPSATRSRCCA